MMTTHETPCCRECAKGKFTPSGFPVLSCTFIVCIKCGYKRCPKADDHKYKCTQSNDVGQTGEVESSP